MGLCSCRVAIPQGKGKRWGPQFWHPPTASSNFAFPRNRIDLLNGAGHVQPKSATVSQYQPVSASPKRIRFRTDFWISHDFPIFSPFKPHDTGLWYMSNLRSTTSMMTPRESACHSEGIQGKVARCVCISCRYIIMSCLSHDFMFHRRNKQNSQIYPTPEMRASHLTFALTPRLALCRLG